VHFTRAIVRPPGRNFASGLTSAADGPPQFDAALLQHRRYCEALRACGVEITRLEADPLYPDGTFVEDAAIVTARGAILTRPGAPTRSGETDSVGRILRAFYPDLLKIDAPGTVDGGDVCEADGHFIIGVSARTNERGANQLREHLEGMGYSTGVVDIRGSETLLHLKTGIAYLGDGVWVGCREIERELEALGGFDIRELISVAATESYAANCVRVNESVLVPAGYPRITQALALKGLHPLPLEMSEFKKMDGGLSCLSLRF
jgi:dimethylargininase